MIFDNLPDDVGVKRLKEIAAERFRILRLEIYKLLPQRCLLKPRNVLTGNMVVLLDTEYVKQGLVEPKDICSLCLEARCPYYNINDRAARISKLELLSKRG